MALKDVPGAVDGLPVGHRLVVILQRFAQGPVTVPPAGGLLYLDSDTPVVGSQPELSSLTPEDQITYGRHVE